MYVDCDESYWKTIVDTLLSHANKRPEALDPHYLRGYTAALSDVDYALHHLDKIVR